MGKLGSKAEKISILFLGNKTNPRSCPKIDLSHAFPDPYPALEPV